MLASFIFRKTETPQSRTLGYNTKSHARICREMQLNFSPERIRSCVYFVLASNAISCSTVISAKKSETKSDDAEWE